MSKWRVLVHWVAFFRSKCKTLVRLEAPTSYCICDAGRTTAVLSYIRCALVNSYPGPKLLRGILLKSFCYLCEVVRKTFPPFFGSCAISTAIARKLWRYLVTKIRNLWCIWKRNPFREKRWKQNQNRLINHGSIVVQNISPSNSALALECKQTKNIQTPYFRNYSRPALFHISKTFHGDRGRRDHSKRWQNFFDPTHSFSYLCTENFRVNDRRTVSQQ